MCLDSNICHKNVEKLFQLVFETQVIKQQVDCSIISFQQRHQVLFQTIYFYVRIPNYPNGIQPFFAGSKCTVANQKGHSSF